MNSSVNPTPQRLYPTRPDALLHLEGLFFLIVTCIAYGHFYPGRWGFFALLFLAPDLALLPYLWSRGRAAAAFWTAHISFDRLMGYGLKYPDEFRRTHIQRAA